MTDLTERRSLERQLRESQKLESVGRLAGGIAHDFNNLLSVILGAVDLAVDSASRGASVDEDLRDIRRAADQAAQLTRQLLAFSRRQVLRPRVVDLNRLLGEMLSMLRRLIGTNIEMAFHPDPLPATARVDPGQMQQVLVNLVVNARDAMPDGGTLTLHVARRSGADGGGGTVEVVVGDTGEGMAASTLEHIFEPFFTTKEGARGTGLGLATVYGIIQQSGGTIGVESHPGQGTRFRIRLPLATDPAGA
jgi:two-component system, cell cycle sensor histidine kinase and response regulator CckA